MKLSMDFFIFYFLYFIKNSIKNYQQNIFYNYLHQKLPIEIFHWYFHFKLLTRYILLVFFDNFLIIFFFTRIKNGLI